MIEEPRSSCPINRTLEILGDHWSLVILRDIALHNRRRFRELLTENAERISAPVLSRRLASLVEAGLLSKSEVARGAAGRYSLTEIGIQTVPLMYELARLGTILDPSASETTADRDPAAAEAQMERLRSAHLG